LTILYNAGVPTLGAPWEAAAGWEKIGYTALENLITQDDKQFLKPWLAESWDVAPDGKSVTFHLRKDVKFQDGTDFNADAVKYNLTSWKPGTSGAVALTSVTSIDVVDPFTVKLNLTGFNVSLLYNIAFGNVGMMVSPTAAKKATTADRQAVDHMVGTGPFKLVEWSRDDHVKFVKWDGYWQKGKPYLDTVVFLNIADPVTKLLAFQSGVGQFAEPLQPKDIADLKSRGYTVGTGTLGFLTLVIPDGANADSPFAKEKVREAAEYAIDKNAIYMGLYKGAWPPAYEQALTDDPYYAPGLTARKYDVAKAKQLLTDSGYPNGFQTTLHVDQRGDKDGQLAIQAYLKAAGINADLDIADVGRYTTMATGGWKGLLMPGFPNPSNLLTLFSRLGTSSYFPSMYRPAGFQAAWDAASVQTDDAKRMSQIQDLIKTMTEQTITIPWYETHPIWVNNGKVNNMSWVTRANQNYWNAADTWLSK
jgi:ABC-type transport system substrate-binding protein